MNFDVCLIKTLWDTYETGIHNGEKNNNNLLVPYIGLINVQGTVGSIPFPGQ